MILTGTSARLLVASLIFTTQTNAAVTRNSASTKHDNNTAIHWKPCEENVSIPLLCGTLDVPLDYTVAKSNKSLTLKLVKLPGKQPLQGSVLVNGGGPGVSSRNYVATVGTVIQRCA
jgi:hypothetical protein